ncbi:MAG: choice-of-anchor I family protein [Nodosilinea sp.]
MADVLEQITSFQTEEGAEILAFDPTRQVLYVVSGGDILQVLDASDPANLSSLLTVDLAEQASVPIGGANSVAYKNGLLAVAIGAAEATDPGVVALVNIDTFAADPTGSVNVVTVGSLPDMVTFSPDGTKVLVANEGEPGEAVDPDGSVSIIDVANGIAAATVQTAVFTAFNGQEDSLRADGVRIFPDATAAQDIEPEYIAVSADGTQAFVTLQENNAVALVDIATATVLSILPLGVTDFSTGNTLDASDRDGGINRQNWPVFGFKMPDSIGTYEANGMTYFVTANEGDDRGDADEPGRGDAIRVGDLGDVVSFGRTGLGLDERFDPALVADEALGRLIVSSLDGDLDGDGDLDQLFSYSARSFSIYDGLGNLVFDSGDDFERIIAEQTPDLFNADDGDPAEFDTRSDNKGPEPEALVLGAVGDRTYAFVGLERAGGGIMAYEITDPTQAKFLQYIRSDADISPEGLTFIPAASSPTGENLLAVANEVSGTVGVFTFTPATRISDIQGVGHSSPLVGETVTDVPGIVTAVDSNGFYLQDPSPDNNPGTSEGIFVFTRTAPTVQVGDSILISGTVSEFIPGGASTGNLSTTQISDATDITVLSSGNALPAATIIGAGGRVPPTEVIDNDLPDPYNVLNDEGTFDPVNDGLDFYEALEGMRVTIEDALAVSGTSRFGEIFTTPNNGAGATGLSDRGTLNIDPTDFNPERVQIQFDSGLLPNFELAVDTGAQLGDVTGVVGYNFGNFEVNVTEPFELVADSELAPEVSELVGSPDALTVASFNVLNLDPNDDDGDTDVADGQFEALAQQIVNSLNSPDIIALQEIQDNDGSVESDITAADVTLQLLVDEIADISGIDYAFIDNPFIGNGTSGGQPGGNIRTAYLYNPDRVSLVDDSLSPVVDAADQQVNEENPFFDSRLPLAATFLFNDEEVSLVNNHFSSKGGSQPLFGATQPAANLQEDPNINGSLDERQAQAQAVKGYVDDILAANAEANVVVLGDLNEFEFISPLQILGTSLTNLTDTLPETERYTFNFEGNSQSLDHLLVSDRLAPGAEFDIVHVNSEFTDSASDHDPILGRFTFEPTVEEDTSLLLDLRNVTGPVTTTFSVNREAAFDNFFGFYAVVDSTGSIDVDSDGTGDLRPGDANYGQTAVANRINVGLTTPNLTESVFVNDIAGGMLYAPFLIVQGTPDDPTSYQPRDLLFAFGAANPDGLNHVQNIGGDLGFEDLLGPNSDFDFNDLVVSVEFA